MYTRAKDYELYCDSQTLTQVVNFDLSLKRLCEYAAEDQIRSYLAQRFDFTPPYGEFTDTDVWSPVNNYWANRRVYLDASAYSTSSTYTLDDLVLQAGNVYLNINDILVPEPFNPNNWQLLGVQYDLFFATLPEEAWNFQKAYRAGDEIFYRNRTYTAVIPSTNIAPDSLYGSTYWGPGTPYLVNSGTPVTDDRYWTPGDNRNNYLLQIYINIVVYNMFMKIAPRNIPQPRKEQYDMAIDWLTKAGAGLVTAELPLLVPEQGSAIRWGSVNKTDNLY